MFSDGNPPPFGSWASPPAAAPVNVGPPPFGAPPAPAPAPPAPVQPQASGGGSPFTGKGLDYVGGSDPNAKTVRLRDRLAEADVERRKAQEEAEARERAAEIRREERLKKIAYMRDMPDSTPAGTGTLEDPSHPNQVLLVPFRIDRLTIFILFLLSCLHQQ